MAHVPTKLTGVIVMNQGNVVLAWCLGAGKCRVMISAVDMPVGSWYEFYDVRPDTTRNGDQFTVHAARAVGGDVDLPPTSVRKRVPATDRPLVKVKIAAVVGAFKADEAVCWSRDFHRIHFPSVSYYLALAAHEQRPGEVVKRTLATGDVILVTIQKTKPVNDCDWTVELFHNHIPSDRSAVAKMGFREVEATFERFKLGGDSSADLCYAYSEEHGTVHFGAADYYQQDSGQFAAGHIFKIRPFKLWLGVNPYTGAYQRAFYAERIEQSPVPEEPPGIVVVTPLPVRLSRMAVEEDSRSPTPTGTRKIPPQSTPPPSHLRLAAGSGLSSAQHTMPPSAKATLVERGTQTDDSDLLDKCRDLFQRMMKNPQFFTDVSRHDKAFVSDFYNMCHSDGV